VGTTAEEVSMRSTLLALALLSAAPTLAQEVPPAPVFGAGCHVWKVYFHELIEHHRAAGATSKPALERALDLSYATYARCVMGGPRSEGELISAADDIKQALLRGSTVAASD
jgi:hypothetical protein